MLFFLFYFILILIFEYSLYRAYNVEIPSNGNNEVRYVKIIYIQIDI